MAAQQSLFPDECPIRAAVDELAQSGIEGRGAVFTKPAVVDFILDLAGYREGNELHRKRLLEPSFGGGDFLLRAVRRLLADWRTSGEPALCLASAIRAVELHSDTYHQTKAELRNVLVCEGLNEVEAEHLTQAWLVCDDFLLTDIEGEFDYVVGNPPYVRLERVPEPLMRAYRDRYRTMFDRADVYVAFFERSLDLLAEGGSLGFICADRWMKNRYGQPLRKMISERFHFAVYVDMYGVDAFHSDVVAYPAINIIRRELGIETKVAFRPSVDAGTLGFLARIMGSGEKPSPDAAYQVRKTPPCDRPWLFDANGRVDLIAKIEARFPSLEEAGCRVGIGVATGADNVFIGDLDALDVEDDRKLPLVMTRDIASGEIVWRGKGVINPFKDEGGLVDLARYPRLAAYLAKHESALRARHVAKKASASWYRTIDRIFPELVDKPKLLIPDIKGGAHVVLDEGCFYPHHNLYFITSGTWNLRALRTVLKSDVTHAFISSYATKMRGGYLRFQAQYLRRLRLPLWAEVPDHLKARLVELDGESDSASRNACVAELYGLTDEDCGLLA